MGRRWVLGGVTGLLGLLALVFAFLVPDEAARSDVAPFATEPPRERATMRWAPRPAGPLDVAADPASAAPLETSASGGLVLDDLGEPVPGARLKFLTPDPDLGTARTSDAWGRFARPTDLPADGVRVEVRHPDYAFANLPLPDEDPSGVLIVTLERHAQLIVDDACLDDRIGARVVAWRPGARSLTMPNDGKRLDPAVFELEPGAWHVLAVRHGRELEALLRAIRKLDPHASPLVARGVVVQLAPGEQRTLVLDPPPRTVLAGRVHDGGRGVPDVLVSGDGPTVRTDEHGRFAVDDPVPGRQWLSARRPGDPFVRTVPVDVPPGGDGYVEIPFEGLALELLARCARTGQPVADAVVHAVVSATPETYRLPAGQQTPACVARHGEGLARTDAEGRARLTRLPAGSYDVWLEASGWLPAAATPVVLREPWRPGADEPVVVLLQRGTPLELTLEDAGPLWSVRLQPGALLGDAARPAGPAPALLPVDLHRASRGDDGPFLAHALRPGAWSLQVDGLHGARRWSLQVPDLGDEAYVLVLDASP